MEQPKISYKEIERRGLTKAAKNAYGIFDLKYFNDKKNLPMTKALDKVRVLPPGRIYTFEYDPLYKDKLDYFDKRPILLVGNNFKAKTTNNRIVNGVNLNFLPPKVKLAILETYYRSFKNVIEAEERALNNDNFQFRQFPFGLGSFFNILYKQLNKDYYKIAIRSYILKRIKDKVPIEYSDWKWVPFIRPKELSGATLGEIYRFYFKDFNKK